MEKPLARLKALALAAALALSLAACGGAPASTPASSAPAGSAASTPASSAASTAAAPAAKPATDRSGAAVTIPEQVGSIVTLAPSLSQTVVDLGLGDAIVGYDLNSVGLDGLDPDAPTFDTVTPDIEALMALAPDVLLVTNLTLYDESAPYQPLIDAGICVLCVPTADSIQGVEEDITFLAAALGVPERGQDLVAGLRTALDGIAATAATIPEEERKSVYFEISAAPYLYSTGSGTYLDELIGLIGADNALADQQGWCSVEAEGVVAADPDVILTNVNYIDDPVGEILARDGWSGVTAVADGAVYTVDNLASSAPNENIAIAAQQMAAAVYPDWFAAAAPAA